MNLKKLNILKKMIQESTDLNEPWDYFFTHFAEQPNFIQTGSPHHDKNLIGIIKGVAEQFFKSVDDFNNIRLLSLFNNNFIHGGHMLNQKIVTIIYFPDIDQGLFAVMSIMDMKVTLARFSKLNTHGDVTYIPNDKKSLH